LPRRFFGLTFGGFVKNNIDSKQSDKTPTAQAKQWHDQIMSRPTSEEEADQGKKAA
jgi:hypothetical protein